MTAPLRRLRAASAAIALCIVLGAVAAPALAQRYAQSREPIAVAAAPIESFDTRDSARRRFGALEFRGGLVLSSAHPAFGGFSGLRLDADGSHFLAVSDRGSWLRGRIVYDNGRPAGIADAEIAPLLGADGRPLAARGWFDAESLENDGGTLYVGLERVQQIVRFDFGRDGLAARGEPIRVPADFKTLSSNKSLECLAVPPPGAPLAGTLIAVTEQSLDANGNHRSFLLKGGAVERFAVTRSDDFDVSDCVVAPGGALLLLERQFSLARGVAIRIRRIALDRLKPGALVDGEELLQADLNDQIDNMEGIAAHRNADGQTILTLISDDNFSPLQRTLLLQFAVVGE